MNIWEAVELEKFIPSKVEIHLDSKKELMQLQLRCGMVNMMLGRYHPEENNEDC